MASPTDCALVSLRKQSSLSAIAPAVAGWPRSAALAVAFLVVVIFDVVLAGHVVGSGLPVDFTVYRLGAAAVLHGLPVYAVVEPVTGLGFTYPVFAAALFTPLAVLPPVVGFGLVLMVNTALYAAVWMMVRTALPLSSRAAPALFTLGWLSEPVASTLANGQVNLLVAALVLVDVTVLRARRGQGIATGLATGLKLTPALFVLMLAGTRQWRAMAMAVGSFLATVVVGALLAPQESWWYWTGGLLCFGRVGAESALGNLSLVGLVARAVGHPQVPIAVTVMIGVLSVAGCLPLLRRLHHRRLYLTGVAACGVLSVLITPISWSHHWIWLPLLALCAWRGASGRAWATAVALVGAVDARWLTVMLGGPPWHHGWPAQLMATSFAALAAALLLAGAHRLRNSGPIGDLSPGQWVSNRNQGKGIASVEAAPAAYQRPGLQELPPRF